MGEDCELAYYIIYFSCDYRELCSICGEETGNLTRHIEEKHQVKDRVYSCLLCGWMTLRRCDFTRHLRLVHESVKPGDVEPVVVEPFERMKQCGRCYFRAPSMEGHVCREMRDGHIGRPLRRDRSRSLVRGFPARESRRRDRSVRPRDDNSKSPRGRRSRRDAARPACRKPRTENGQFDRLTVTLQQHVPTCRAAPHEPCPQPWGRGRSFRPVSY